MVERVASAEAKSTSTVLIACKLPNGVVLQHYRMVERDEMTPQGPKKTPMAVKDGLPVTIKGVALRFGQVPEFQMYNGYAITEVPRDFWDKWVAQNPGNDLLEKKMLMVAGNAPDIIKVTQEAKQGKVKSGMEPIDPKNPPKVGGRMKNGELIV